MKVTPEKNEKVAQMVFSSIYPHYLNRIEKNGRSKAELNEVIEWLTGYDEDQLKALLKENVTFGEFFKRANIHENAALIKASCVVIGLKKSKRNSMCINNAGDWKN